MCRIGHHLQQFSANDCLLSLFPSEFLYSFRLFIYTRDSKTFQNTLKFQMRRIRRVKVKGTKLCLGWKATKLGNRMHVKFEVLSFLQSHEEIEGSFKNWFLCQTVLLGRIILTPPPLIYDVSGIDTKKYWRAFIRRDWRRIIFSWKNLQKDRGEDFYRIS